jgi:large subunit ribosomal protein L22
MEAEIKPRRSVLKRQKKEAAKKARTQGAADAMLKNVPTSPRKMRLVVDLIRGEKVNKALSILKYHPQAPAKRLEKLLLSAIANWEIKNEGQRIEEADLFIKEISVDGGRMLKRLRPAPQGRAYRVRKRSNHVYMVIDSLTSPSPVATEEVQGEEVKTEAKKTVEKKAASKAKKSSEAKAKSEKKETKKN